MDNCSLDYSKLLDEFGEDKISDRCDWLRNCMLTFIKHNGLEEKVSISERVLYHVIIDYFVDIQRLKEFQNIKVTNRYKIFAYTTYWILRHKPLQIVGDISENEVFVNEKFCSDLIQSFLFDNPDSVPILQDSKDSIIEFVDTMLYYFKYRDVTPKCIELMLIAFEAGRGYQLSVDRQH